MNFISSMRIKKLVFPSACILLWITATFRFDVGLDYMSYVNVIEKMLGDKTSAMEPVFTAVVYTSEYVFGQFKAVIISAFGLHSFLYLYFCYRFITYFNPNDSYFSMVLIFLIPIYYLASLNAIRNSAAIAIVAYSMRYVVERRLFRYLVTVMFAYGVHKTAIVFIPMYWLLNRRFNIYQLTSIALLSVLGTLYFSKFLNILENIKLSDQYFNEVESFQSVTLMGMLLAFISAILICNKNFRMSKNGCILVNLLFSCVALIVCQPFSSVGHQDLFYRFSGYFSIYLVVAIPVFLNTNHFINPTLAKTIIFVLGSSYFWITITKNGQLYNLAPYKSIIFEKI